MAAAASELQRACYETVSVGHDRANIIFGYHMYELIWMWSLSDNVKPHLHISYMEV